MKKRICVLGTVVALSVVVGCVPAEAVDGAEPGTVSAALGNNLLVNGSFTTSMSGWTETVTGGDGHGGSGWDASGYANGGGLLTSIAPGCQSQDYCVGNYQNYWAQQVQLTAGSSRTLSFAYLSQHGVYSFAGLSVVLIRPSYPCPEALTLFSTSGTGGAWQTQSQNISSYLTVTGTYELRLVSDIGNDLGVYAEGRFDEVGIY
jgi:hypothetical protein